MIIPAPAKVNLYLKIIGKRNDGYHDIETLFERVSILDQVSVNIAEERTTITCSNSRISTDADSLMGKTVELFKQKNGEDICFDIRVEKNIPIGAGLGGGSSDAAAILKGLNEITGFVLQNGDLIDIAAGLGADVPFFMNNYRFAYGSGRGDIIREISRPGDIWHIIVNPPFEVSTKEVYSKATGFGLTKNIGIDKIISTFSSGKNIKGLSKNFHNDLQAIVLRDFSILEKVFYELDRAGAEVVLLSGSGPTVFGIFDQKEVVKAAEKMKQIFPEEKQWKVFAAKTY